MSDLIRVELNDKQEAITTGRELHEFLQIGTQYTKWFDKMKEYGFEEGVDFVLVSQKRLTNNQKNPITEITDHIIKMDMAKEIAMIQRTERGKQARQYFIECEKRLKNQTQGNALEGTVLLASQLASVTNVLNQYITNSTSQMEQIQKAIKQKDSQIDKVLEVVGLKSNKVTFLTELLKEKLSDITGRTVTAKSIVYDIVKKKILLKFHVVK